MFYWSDNFVQCLSLFFLLGCGFKSYLLHHFLIFYEKNDARWPLKLSHNSLARRGEEASQRLRLRSGGRSTNGHAAATDYDEDEVSSALCSCPPTTGSLSIPEPQGLDGEWCRPVRARAASWLMATDTFFTKDPRRWWARRSLACQAIAMESVVCIYIPCSYHHAC